MEEIKMYFTQRLDDSRRSLNSGTLQFKRLLSELQKIPIKNGEDIERFVKNHTVPLARTLKNDFSVLESSITSIKMQINQKRTSISGDLLRLNKEELQLKKLKEGAQKEVSNLHLAIKENDKNSQKDKNDLTAAEAILKKFKKEKSRFMKKRSVEILMGLESLIPDTKFLFDSKEKNNEALQKSQVRQETRIASLKENLKKYQSDTINKEQRIKVLRVQIEHELPGRINQVNAEKTSVERTKGNLATFTDDVERTAIMANVCHQNATTSFEAFDKMAGKKGVIGSIQSWWSGVKNGTEVLKAVIPQLELLVKSLRTLSEDGLISNNTIIANVRQMPDAIINLKKLSYKKPN